MSDAGGRLPPLPPSPLPHDLVARCRAAFIACTVRAERAELEVHRTHVRIVTPVVDEVTTYARRMGSHDLVLSFEQIRAVRPVGLMTFVLELPRDGAVALMGPGVRRTMACCGDAVRVEPRHLRPFFVGFWLINHRSGRVDDARPLP